MNLIKSNILIGITINCFYLISTKLVDFFSINWSKKFKNVLSIYNIIAKNLKQGWKNQKVARHFEIFSEIYRKLFKNNKIFVDIK